MFSFFKNLQCNGSLKDIARDEGCDDFSAQFWFSFFNIAHVGLLSTAVIVLIIFERRPDIYQNFRENVRHYFGI